jgi:hypothetical protein
MNTFSFKTGKLAKNKKLEASRLQARDLPDTTVSIVNNESSADYMLGER